MAVYVDLCINIPHGSPWPVVWIPLPFTCTVNVVLKKPPQEKNQVVLGLVIWLAMQYTVVHFTLAMFTRVDKKFLADT